MNIENIPRKSPDSSSSRDMDIANFFVNAINEPPHGKVDPAGDTESSRGIFIEQAKTLIETKKITDPVAIELLRNKIAEHES